MRPLVLSALLAGCGGPEVNVRELFPEAAVSPPAVEFGDQAVPVETVGELFITNAGKADLTAEITFAEGDPKVFTLSETKNDEIAPDETWVVEVGFLPTTFLDYEATLTITTNDDTNGTIVVPISGTGINAPLPDIHIDPLVVDFGEVDINKTGTAFFTIENRGTADLQLGKLKQDGADTFDFFGPDPSETVVAAGSVTTVLMGYTPTHEDGDNQTITINSNDPDEPKTTVTLLGNGGGLLALPIAEIDCPALAEPPEWVELDGSASFDPDGLEPLDYSWTITEIPQGSTNAALTTLTDPVTEMFFDIAGDYQVQLVVTNTLGLPSGPAICDIEAIPSDELHIELTWDTPSADLDLHLLEAGTALFETPGDACWCNTNPKWGAAGSDNDPRLDIDDLGGFGPENINLEIPDDGDYEIKVHYFAQNGDNAVTAIVKTYLFGSLVDESTKVMTNNQVWDVGTVEWSATPTFTASTTALYDTDDRDCF